METAKSRGEWFDPALGRLTFGKWAASWLAGQSQLRPSTHNRYERILQHQVLPWWEKVPLAAISHADVVAWVGDLVAKEYAPATVRQAHRVFSLILGLAVRDGRLARNVAQAVRLPRIVPKEKRFLTHEQVSLLADACGPSALAVRFLAYTGLRWGEFAALRVRHVDLTRRRVTVAESAAEVQGKIIFGPTKTHQRRVVVLPRFLVDPLAEHIGDRPADELLFPAPNGGVMRNSNFRHRVLTPAAESVGLAGLSPHDLRHTAASLAIAAGANVKVVQQMMGHASAAMTLDVYAGLFGDDLDAVAESLDAAARRSNADILRTSGPRLAVVPLQSSG
ncbi:MAG TPA: tyrosine-type recombinase/integrase [Dermatophilaceae bacterium]|nr:tyrosine-type recombinase/integrase [Dermatophilaceae bacterium]